MTDGMGRDGARGLHVVACPTGTAAQQEADLACRRSLARGARVVRIVANSSLGTQCRRRLADEGGFPMGLQVSTMSAWLRERWSLYGDGRRLVSSGQRRALVLLALENTPLRRMDPSAPGMPRCVEDALRVHAGTPAMRPRPGEEDPWEQAGATASASQREMLQVCRTYQQMLDEHVLIEQSDLAASLPDAMGASGWSDLVLDGISELPLPQVRLLAKAARHAGVTVTVRAPGPGASHPDPAAALASPMVAMLAQAAQDEGVPFSARRSDLQGDAWADQEMGTFAATLFRPHPGTAVHPTGKVRFSLPEGAYAEPRAIADQLRRLVEEDGVSARNIVVCCRDPLGAARAVWGRLHGEGPDRVGCLAQGSLQVALTQVGRALLGLAQIALALRDLPADEASPALRPVASDLARIPLLQVDEQDAFKADLAWRAAPQTCARTFAHDLSRLSEPARAALDAMAEGNVAGALDALCPPRERQDVARITDAALKGELAAADTLRRRLGEARDMGIEPLRELERLTDGVSVNVRELFADPAELAAQRDASVLRDNPDAVRFMELRDVEGLHVRAVVVCGLNADGATDPVDPLGLSEQISVADRMRWRFSAAVEAAGEFLVLERRLHDEATGELRPSSLFEEAVDCYRTDPTDLDGLDKRTGMPAGGVLGEETPGEEDFPSALSPVGAALADRASTPLEPPVLSLVHAASRQMLADPATPISPSSLEAYLRCPLRWFYERRLPSSTPDAGFDQLATGTFSHAVLQRFHEQLPARCHIPRVDAAALEDVATRDAIEKLIEDCIRQVEREHADPASDVQNRLVPVGQVQRRRLDAVEAAVRDCIMGDVRVPAGFNPVLAEWSFGLPGSGHDAVPYAGALLRGTIDRVDADEGGRALVIDYKGGVYPGHGVPRAKKDGLPAGWPLPLHSQALMYAAALDRATGGELRPVGAVYLSYSSPTVRGFVDGDLGVAVESGLVERHDLCPPPEQGADEDTDGAGRPTGGFGALMARLEAEAAEALARLFDGCIEPSPRFSKDSCDRCLVTWCQKREA